MGHALSLTSALPVPFHNLSFRECGEGDLLVDAGLK
jgi:hypothetical protein